MYIYTFKNKMLLYIYTHIIYVFLTLLKKFHFISDDSLYSFDLLFDMSSRLSVIK